MRILFTFAGLRGHLEPLVPIARAAQAAGHTVAFAPDPRLAQAVAARGFDVLGPAAPPEPAPAPRKPLVPFDRENEERLMREAFIGRIGRERAGRLIGLFADWRPDVVVSDETDFGAGVAAERLGLPRARLLVLATGWLTRPQVVAEPLDALRAEHRLPAESPREPLVLSPFSHRLRPLPANALAFRTAPVQRPPTDARTVYFTLGTIFNLESGDLFERVLEGLRELPVDVVATVGRNLDPDELGPQPANVRIERYLPQSEVLPRCRAVVSHGGSGSLLAALAHGLPSVLLPMGADQPQNAARCAQLGVARVLDALRATPATVREAVADVLSDPRYGSAAERIADEIAALPGPEDVIGGIERLAR
jgi:UDP:flavonoid glycosyltransferase YjiC (YdhE family)